MLVGSMPINITNVHSNSFAPQLGSAISILTPLSHTINMNLGYLNSEAWMAPDQKRHVDGMDYGLAAGQLQLLPSTWVLVNETVMCDGTLSERGNCLITKV